MRLCHPQGRDRARARRRASKRSAHEVVELSPFLSDRVGELKSWDDVKLLSVTVDRLRQWWRPGLICIGDAAHAMSPIGGVGINLAVQDAVAAANRLAGPLRAGKVTDDGSSGDREATHAAMRFTQRLQLVIQQPGHQPRSWRHERPKPPPFFKLFGVFPILRRIPARLIGLGIRPEHVRTPEAAPPSEVSRAVSRQRESASA